MAIIEERHVEWRVVDRMRELLEHQPKTEHDVTLSYSLFTTILCWTAQRLRDETRPLSLWDHLQQERAADQSWGVLDLKRDELKPGTSRLDELPGGAFLVGLRNATAHGDDRRVRPYHVGRDKSADRRLGGFVFDAEFYSLSKDHRGEPPTWGKWRLTLSSVDMRRIGLALAERFCNELSGDARRDAERHVLIA
jgi:hypothetical protein